MKTTNLRTGVYRLPALALTVVSVLLFAYSCTTMDRAAQYQVPDRIMAENSQMKKRIPLIERENDVLTQENLQYKARLQAALERVEHLRSDIAYLNDKFDAYIATSETQINILEQNYSLLENTSFQQISELSSRYAQLQLKSQQEIAELNSRMAKEKDLLVRKAAEKEAALTRRAAETKRLLDEREAELAFLKTANGDLQEKLDTVSGQLAETQAERSQIEKDLQTIRAANIELLQRLQNTPPDGLMLNSLIRPLMPN